MALQTGSTVLERVPLLEQPRIDVSFFFSCCFFLLLHGAGRPLQVVEAALVHPQRQLPLLLRVHHRQGAPRHHPPGKHSGSSFV